MAIEIYCIRGNGDKEKSGISDPLLSSESAAIERGKHEIDNQWYFVHSQTINVPFKKAFDSTMMMDDDIIEVSDALLGISGNRKIKDIVLSGDVSDVKLDLTLERFEEYL